MDDVKQKKMDAAEEDMRAVSRAGGALSDAAASPLDDPSGAPDTKPLGPPVVAEIRALLEVAALALVASKTA
jgi:hypothetical protein